MFKMIARRAFIILASLTFMGGVTATLDVAHAQRSNQEIVDIENESLPAGASFAQVEQAVLTALSARGWAIIARAPGSVDAKYERRDFSATIHVTYSAEDFSVRYVTSEGLRYSYATRQIHPSYNRWINNLRFDVRLFVQNAMVGTTSPTVNQ